MKKKLPSNYSDKKYGVDFRLVNEEDAEFIVKLRTDPQLNRFLHATDCSIEKQKEWIREYKKRESEGIDYYFYYSQDGTPIGVNRVYDIHDDRGTGGSWICQKGLSMELPIITFIILREIMFEQIDLEYDYFDVRKDNKQVIKMHLLFGADKIGEDELNYYYVISKEKFYRKSESILRMLI
jgi:hypothetical protein